MRNLIISSFAFLSLSVYGQGYFQQEVHYTISVTLNDEDHTLSGFETLEYINNSGQALDCIYMHLWPNGYRDNKTALAKVPTGM